MLTISLNHNFLPKKESNVPFWKRRPKIRTDLVVQCVCSFLQIASDWETMNIPTQTSVPDSLCGQRRETNFHLLSPTVLSKQTTVQLKIIFSTKKVMATKKYISFQKHSPRRCQKVFATSTLRLFSRRDTRMAESTFDLAGGKNFLRRPPVSRTNVTLKVSFSSGNEFLRK